MTALQNDVQRDQDKASCSENRSNFLQILHLVSKGGVALRTRILDPGNMKRTDYCAQKRIIRIFAEITKLPA